MKTPKIIQPLIHYLIAALSASGAMYISYLILDDNNEFGVAVLMIWMSLNIVPNIFGMLTGENAANVIGIGFYICVGLQWFLLGAIASVHIMKSMNKLRAKETKNIINNRPF